MVEEDFGHDLALMVARRLVVFLKRPGGQSQFSIPLQAQTVSGPLSDLARWVTDNPAADHRVEALAERASMTTRSLHRMFHRTFQRTPAQWIAEVRVEAARRLLEESDDRLDQVALQCGLGLADSMRRLFVRRFGVTPLEYRQRFRREPAPSSAALQHASHSSARDAFQ
jgi:transcriptional regulator GlxA family with amidase domain